MFYHSKCTIVLCKQAHNVMWLAVGKVVFDLLDDRLVRQVHDGALGVVEVRRYETCSESLHSSCTWYKCAL
jgi:hypothetical protein